jgi:hypothetical protein
MAKAKSYAREIDRLRKLCLSFPEATEKLSHGEPTWFCRKVFCSLSNNHHGDGIVALTCPAPPGVQEAMIEEDPERFYRPPYVGPSGWLGVRLDRDPDWDEIAAIVEEAYRLIAPKRLVAQLDA